MTLSIKATGLTKKFGDVVALNGIDIEVEEGTVLGLLGPNGSGKTTIVRILATLIQADSGSASVGGFNVATQQDDVRNVIGLTGQYAAVDEYLTGRENLELFGRLFPRSRQGMWKVIEELVSEGTTVLLTTQYLEEADQLANRIVVLDHGNVIAKGTSNELKSQVGGDRIEIVVDRVSDLAKTAELINGIGSAPATIEEVTKTVLLPVSGGSKAIVDVVRKLDENNIVIADIALRRPTLDDVFLSLTGHATEAPQTPDAPKGRRGRKARR